MDTKNVSKTELKEQFIELRALGYSFAAIVEKLGVSKPTLIGWSKELVVQIGNARNLHIEELSARFTVSKEKRIEVFGKRLEAILEELDKRDLSELEIDKLLSFALKYGEMLRADSQPLVLTEKRSFTAIDLDAGTESWEA